METITIVLNGKEISGRPGMTILDLAREVGVKIPTLCHDKHLAPFGACRVCIVEDEKRHALVASCVTPIAPDMQISTESPLVLETRRTVVELLLSSHPEACVICDKGNRCDLRAMAADLGIGEIDLDRIRRFTEIEDANAFIERDLSKCILCGKCVRACQEIQVVGAIDYAGRGYNARPSTPFDMPLDQSACEYCGTCVTLCPVGALSEKSRTYRGAGLENVATVCSFCGSGCSILLQTRDNRVMSVRPNPENSVNGVSLCVRGHYGHDYIHSADRLTEPLIRRNGALEPASWDQALDLVAERLGAIKSESGPQSISVLGSFRCTNEENYLLQKFARVALGTNNIINSARMSASPTIVGLTKALGYAAATNVLDDIEHSRAILMLGANPHESHPLVAQKIKRAVKFHGAKLLLSEPRRTKMTPFAHQWIQPNPGTDIALLNGMMRVILDENLHHKSFVRDRTLNFEKLMDCVKRYPPAYVEKITGVPEADIAEAARAFAAADSACIIYGSGITQYPNATYSVLAIANLALLTGNVGRAGAGVYPLVKENNGQGACDMGVLPDYLPGYRKVTDADARAVLEKEWNAPLPEGEGLSAMEIITQAASGGIRAMVNVGANPVATFADSNTMKQALEALDFFVALDIFPTPTTNLAHVVLPVACFAEKDGTFTNTERRIQRVRKAVDPPGQSRPEWVVLKDLFERMGFKSDYKSPSDIMDEIARTTPIYAGVSYARLEREVLHWPCTAPDHPGTRMLYTDEFPSGARAGFMKVEYLVPDDEPDMNFPFSLITRSHLYHFGSGARTRHSRQLSEVFPECFLEIGPEDARGLCVDDGQPVKIVSRSGALELCAKITPGLPPKTVFVPVSLSAAEVNSLFSAELDMVTRIPNRKMCTVQIERV